jgi:hypothetical protein
MVLETQPLALDNQTFLFEPYRFRVTCGDGERSTYNTKLTETSDKSSSRSRFVRFPDEIGKYLNPPWRRIIVAIRKLAQKYYHNDGVVENVKVVRGYSLPQRLRDILISYR